MSEPLLLSFPLALPIGSGNALPLLQNQWLKPACVWCQPPSF